MDDRTRELIRKGSVLRGLLVWGFGRPDNPLVTPVNRFVSILSRLTMFLTAIVVVITFSMWSCATCSGARPCG